MCFIKEIFVLSKHTITCCTNVYAMCTTTRYICYTHTHRYTRTSQSCSVARYNQLRAFVLMDVAWCVESPAESEIKSGLRAPRHQELRDPPLPSPLRDPWSRIVWRHDYDRRRETKDTRTRRASHRQYVLDLVMDGFCTSCNVLRAATRFTTFLVSYAWR